MPDTVRTRFAPSPTGHLHLGGARTALFNYLFARHHGGCFILRVEDTDRERSTPESIEAILDSLAWLRLDADEEPSFQSRREEIYREQIERLLREGGAYRCYCTAAELDAKREKAIAEGRNPRYDRTCRQRRDAPANVPFTIRFKAPLAGETRVVDHVRGTVIFDRADLDDIILARTDGSPTYNFCCVVDDALMQITHVIRGEDHLTNTAKQIPLYESLGFSPPEYAHVSLIHGHDGSRLSKRHGATSVTAYRDAGYLPEALNNYLARLGWSHGDQEIFSPEELVEKFSLEHVSRAAAIFNPEKLEWVNFQHLKAKRPEDLVQPVRDRVVERGWSAPGDDTWMAGVIAAFQERARTLTQLVDAASYFFTDDIEIDPKARSKHLEKADPAVLEEVREHLAALPDWTPETIEQCIRDIAARHELGLGKIAQPLRVLLTGGTVSPGIFEVIHLLGRDRTLQRIGRAGA